MFAEVGTSGRAILPIMLRILLHGAAVLLSASAFADQWRVMIRTNEGSEIAGTVELTKLHFESDLGNFELDPASIETIEPAGETVAIRLRDGTRMSGRLDIKEWKIATKLGDLTLPQAKLKLICSIVPVAPAPKPEAPPGGTRVPDPAADPTSTADLTPVKRGDASISIVGVSVLSADGTTLFCIDSGASKLCAISTDSLATVASADLSPGANSFSISPDSTTAWIAGGSTASIVSLPDLKVKKTFQIEYRISDILAIEGGLALATTNAGLVVLDPQKQAALGVRQEISGSLQPQAGTDRVFTGNGTFSWKIDSSQPGGVRITFLPRGSSSQTAALMLTADGRFGVSCTGDFFRLGRSHFAGCLPVGKLTPNTAGVGLKEKLLLFTNEGFLKIYDVGTFELTRSLTVGLLAQTVLADEKKGIIYVFGVKKGSLPPSGQPAGRSTPSPSGSWYRYSIP